MHVCEREKCYIVSIVIFLPLIGAKWYLERVDAVLIQYLLYVFLYNTCNVHISSKKKLFT